MKPYSTHHTFRLDWRRVKHNFVVLTKRRLHGSSGYAFSVDVQGHTVHDILKVERFFCNFRWMPSVPQRYRTYFERGVQINILPDMKISLSNWIFSYSVLKNIFAWLSKTTSTICTIHVFNSTSNSSIVFSGLSSAQQERSSNPFTIYIDSKVLRRSILSCQIPDYFQCNRSDHRVFYLSLQSEMYRSHWA